MSPERSTSIRVRILFVAMLLACLLVVGKTVYLQTVEGDHYRKMVQDNRREVRVPATRGDILARDGRKLACSVPNYQIAIDPCADGLPDSVFNRDIGRLAVQLARLFGDRTPAEYRDKLVEERSKGRHYFRLGKRRITHTELQQVRQFAIFKRGRNRGGLIVEPGDLRKLPFGLLAARTIGKLYNEKELGGMVGLENAYNTRLRGKDGQSNRIRMTGKWIEQEARSPINGQSLRTTIDIDIQDVAEYSLLNQLREHEADHGVALLMEVRTGAVRAIVNLHRQPDGSYNEDHYNYAIGELAEPGSTFKLATLICCLEDGNVTLDDSIDTYRGEYKFYDRTMRDSKEGGHGRITLRRAFEVSSNIGLSRMAEQCYKGEPQRFVDRLRDLGLCDSLRLDIKGAGQTYLKNADDPTWSGISLPWMSIGYEIKLTPLQLLTFYNAVANNGTMMQPMFVEAILDHGREVERVKPTVMRNFIATRRTIVQVQDALKGVVERGTAMNISHTNYKIAGKTGTAQIAQDASGYKKDGQRQYLASFAGYFPADDPLYSCVVMVYGPSKRVYYGNVVAGTVVKDIADRVYAAEFRKGTGKIAAAVPLSPAMPRSKGGLTADLVKVFAALRIPHSVNTSSEWCTARADADGVRVAGRYTPPGIVPDVRGQGAADAVALLESRGYRVGFSGLGKVVAQSPLAGEELKKGYPVYLTLSN